LDPILQGLGRIITQGDCSSFDLKQVGEAIAGIGITVAELDEDWADASAYLRRTFCLLEAFDTIKGKGQLLVCGPAVKDPLTALALARVATDAEKNKDIVDSRAAQCRHADQKKRIDQFIADSVGFNKLDKLVMASIVGGCMRIARSASQKDPAGTARLLLPLARMLLEVEEMHQANVWAQEANRLYMSIHQQGPTIIVSDRSVSLDMAEYQMLAGECVDDGSPGKMLAYYANAQRLLEGVYGEGHIATARCLVLIARVHGGLGESARIDAAQGQSGAISSNHELAAMKREGRPKQLEYATRALGIIERHHGRDTIESEEALEQVCLGTQFCGKAPEEQVSSLLQRHLRVLETHYGDTHHKVGKALCAVGSFKFEQGQRAVALQYMLRAVPIIERSVGRLSYASGTNSQNMGVMYMEQRQWVKAIECFEKALAAFTFMHSADSVRVCGLTQNYLRRAQQGLANERVSGGTAAGGMPGGGMPGGGMPGMPPMPPGMTPQMMQQAQTMMAQMASMGPEQQAQMAQMVGIPPQMLQMITSMPPGQMAQMLQMGQGVPGGLGGAPPGGMPGMPAEGMPGAAPGGANPFAAMMGQMGGMKVSTERKHAFVGHAAEDYGSLSVKEVKRVMAQRGISTAGCVEKVDMVQRLQGRDQDSAATVDAAAIDTPSDVDTLATAGSVNVEAQACREGRHCQQCTRAFERMSAGYLKPAKTLYEAAAAQGHTRAQFALAQMSFMGIGGEVDLEGARALYEQAAESGCEEAAEILRVLPAGKRCEQTKVALQNDRDDVPPADSDADEKEELEQALALSRQLKEQGEEQGKEENQRDQQERDKEGAAAGGTSVSSSSGDGCEDPMETVARSTKQGTERAADAAATEERRGAAVEGAAVEGERSALQHALPRTPQQTMRTPLTDVERRRAAAAEAAERRAAGIQGSPVAQTASDGAARAIERAVQMWVCSVCTLNNAPSAESCAVCNVGQRSAPAKPIEGGSDAPASVDGEGGGGEASAAAAENRPEASSSAAENQTLKLTSDITDCPPAVQNTMTPHYLEALQKLRKMEITGTAYAIVPPPPHLLDHSTEWAASEDRLALREAR
jgi:tetratricopeptide (TPR) repeat protein